MPKNRYTPGDSPLGAVNSGDPTLLLGGRPFETLDPEDVLSRVKLGLFESGAIEQPVYGYGCFAATTGAWQSIGMTPPDGVTWRVWAASAFIRAPAGPNPGTSSTKVWLGVAPGVSAQIPEVLAGGTPEAPDPTMANCAETGLAFATVALAPFPGSFLLRFGDYLIARANHGAGSELVLHALYSELPGSGAPPR